MVLWVLCVTFWFEGDEGGVGFCACARSHRRHGGNGGAGGEEEGFLEEVSAGGVGGVHGGVMMVIWMICCEGAGWFGHGLHGLYGLHGFVDWEVDGFVWARLAGR